LKKLFRIRFPWPALLSLIVAVTAGCSGGGGEGWATATSRREAITVPTATTTFPATIEPTETISSTIPAGPLQGEALVAALRGGGYIIYFRHAATDPVPDDIVPVVLADCDTQRNLSADGRAQAREIGAAIERLEIPIGRVLSSPFCRALDTAQLAIGKATTELVLENLETAESEAEREDRIDGLRSLLSDSPQGVTNSVQVSHGFNINASAGVTIAEGEAAIFRPDGEGGFVLVATLTSQESEELAAANLK
jgi:phosphohistidine phosphatase SixA